MQFDTAAYLKRATSRAKSDVANKLVSMLLHELSRRVTSAVGASVTSLEYTKAVAGAFGDRCAYCQRTLEADRASVEHLDGMNRFRIGLHIQGNVVVACKRCNSAKRQDDQLETLKLATTGWESFLSHDGARCPDACKSCAYWRTVWPESTQRELGLRDALTRIRAFRESYGNSVSWGLRVREIVKDRVHSVYRECQISADQQIQAISEELFQKLNVARPETQ